nr:reverse transcriptase domain-containing protein [Tanacetum cinerariifolium]
MAEMLRAPTEGCAESIVVPPILVEQFELKHSLINMMTSEQCFGLEKDNPHDHIRWGSPPMGQKRTPRSITTWDDLILKFINEFFPPSRTTNVRNEILNFQQKFDESFHEAWERYKDLLRACPHHGFTELHQLDTFYNALNPADQDSLNAAVGGNSLEKSPQDAAVTTAMTAMLKQLQANPPPAQVKAVEEICVTCGGNYNQGNPGYRPQGVANQMRQPDMVKNELRNEMKTSIQTSLSNQTNEIKNMIASLLQMNTASTSGSGSLPSNTVANPKGELKAITTRSGLATDGPTIPIPPKFVTPEEDECIEETYTTQISLSTQSRSHLLQSNNLSLQFKDTLFCIQGTLLHRISCLPDLIPTRMTLELANRAICTPDGIARDVFVPVGKFTFPADFVVVDYESNHRVPLILGRPFLRTARALIDVYGEEMILHDGDERLTLNMKHVTASYSNHPHRESVNLINIFNISSEDCLEVSVSNKQSSNPTFSLHKEITLPEVTHELHDSEGCNFLFEKLPDIDSFNDIHPHFDDDPLSGTTTYSSNSLLKEFTDELALITYPSDYDDNLTCDIESDLREIELLLYQSEDSDLKDLIDKTDLANRDDLFVDPIPEMFTNEQPPDYSFPPRFDVSEIAKLTHAVNQQTSDVTTAMTTMLKQLQANPPPAQVRLLRKSVLPAEGNPGYRPQVVANQMRPPGFAQPNVQNNQNRFGQPQGFNHGTNINQEQPYQATAQSNQNFHLNELEKIKRMNDVSLKAMQNQIDMVKNKLRNEMKTSIQTSLSNQTNEIKNMMASLLQMNTACTSGSGSLPGNTVANPKGELKAITTRSRLATDGPTVPTPPKSVNLEEDECVEETYTDPDLTKYTIKVPPPPVQKPKPPIQRHFVLHTRDSPPPHILHPSRMLKQKQQKKDDIQIQKFWNMFKQLHLNITLAEALVLMPRYQKMLKALLSNKEKLQELANTPLNENCSAVILKKLPEKLGDPGKFRIPCGFSELKCKALADLGASINLMPLSVWKKLGLPDLIPTRMTLELANRAICTPDGIARDVFVPVGKFTFLADFVVVDYESDLRVPLILGRPFLRTARALINVHATYSNHPHRESVNLIKIFNIPSEDCLEVSVSNKQSGNPTFSLHKEITLPEVTHEFHDSKGCNFLSDELPDIDSFNDIHPYFDDDPLSGSTTYSSNSLLEEFTDELAFITYPLDYDDNLKCDIESDLREIEFLLYQGEDSDLKDSIDQSDLANRDDLFVDPTPAMFTNEQPPDYSFPPRFDVYPDDFLEIESDADNFDDDFFDSKGEKIKEAELLIDQLDLPCDIHSEYDSFNSQDFSKDDDLPSPDNEDKVFNLGILIHEKSVKIITRVAQEKKLAVSYASLVFEDFDPPFYELLVFKDVPNSMRLSCFQSQPNFYKPDEDFSCSKWKEYSSRGCSSVPFLSPLIRSSMGEFGPAL